MVTNKATSIIRGTMKNALTTAALTFQWIFPDALPLALGPLSERANQTLTANEIIEAPIPSEWSDPQYRRVAMEATLENLIAWQVRINREERGMTQVHLATLMGTKQSAISKLEDPEGGDVLLSTLVKAAHAFDCALMVRLIDYELFASRTRDVRPERLFAASFTQIHPLVTAKRAKRAKRTRAHLTS